MKREIGLWIDHRETVFVTIEDETEMTRKITSNVSKQIRKAGGLQAKEPHSNAMTHAEDMIDRRYDNRLNGYYDAVISLIRDADSILLFGPGEAKVELETRLKLNNLGERIVGVETVGKMTEPQIAAKVRDYFLR
jgi:hypothetical protein